MYTVAFCRIIARLRHGVYINGASASMAVFLCIQLFRWTEVFLDEWQSVGARALALNTMLDIFGALVFQIINIIICCYFKMNSQIIKYCVAMW